jgi:hypothetical protein
VRKPIADFRRQIARQFRSLGRANFFFGFENEGTKVPSVMESTILIKNKAGFRNVALSFSAVCGVPIALSGKEDGQRKQHKNEGTKLPCLIESTILIKNKAGFRNVALSFSAV